MSVCLYVCGQNKVALLPVRVEADQGVFIGSQSAWAVLRFICALFQHRRLTRRVDVDF